MAALELLVEQPRRVERLLANADALRDELAREGFEVAGASTHIVPLLVGDAEPARADRRVTRSSRACSSRPCCRPACPTAPRACAWP